MAKAKKGSKKKAEALTETFDFYVATQNGSSPELFVIDYDAQAHQPVFGANIDAAIWSTKGAKIDTFINQNNLNNVTKTGKNGEHPSQRPPL